MSDERYYVSPVGDQWEVRDSEGRGRTVHTTADRAWAHEVADALNEGRPIPTPALDALTEAC